MALFCGLKPGEILALRYGNFDPEEGTVVVNELHTRNYHPADENVWAPRYYNRELRSKSHYRTLPVPEFLFREIEVRKKQNKHILQKSFIIFSTVSLHTNFHQSTSGPLFRSS